MTDGRSGSAPDHRVLGVSIAPPKSVEVEYFESKTLSLYFTNRSNDTLLVDVVTLQFQTDGSTAAHYTDHTCGLRIGPKVGESFAVQVRPTPIYMANTNSIELMVKYRIESKGTLGDIVTDRHPASYLTRIIHENGPTQKPPCGMRRLETVPNPHRRLLLDRR